MENKTIWMYWAQGWDNAPELVQQCRRSWKELNADYEVIALDACSLANYIDLPFSKHFDLSMAIQSDVIRLELLLKYGGIWADATLMCSKPLYQWLPEYYTKDFFAFRNPGKDRLLSSWFLVAEPNNILLITLHKELTSFLKLNSFSNQNNSLGRVYRTLGKMIWSNTVKGTLCWHSEFVRKKLRVYPYYIFHYMFNKIISENKACRDVWEQSIPYNADLPHTLQKIPPELKNITRAKEFIQSKLSPVHKLNWRIEADSLYWTEVLGTLACLSNN